MELFYNQLAKSSYGDSLKVLEADIQHANSLCNGCLLADDTRGLWCQRGWDGSPLVMPETFLPSLVCLIMAVAIPKAKDGAYVQMKLAYNHVAPLYLFLLQWMDYTCTCLLPRYSSLFHILIYKVYPDGRVNISSYGRKATIREFYAVILPSLEQLQGNSIELDATMEKGRCIKMFGGMRVDERRKFSDIDLERETECGICMEPCAKMVLPNCCHSMCINCYRDWNTRSESCPFCRGSLKRVSSRDLWVLTGNGDFVDNETVAKEELLRFYYYVNSLPQDIADNLFLMYYEYLI